MLALGRAALIESNDGTFILTGFNNDIGNILIFSKGILVMARSVILTQICRADSADIKNKSRKRKTMYLQKYCLMKLILCRLL